MKLYTLLLTLTFGVVGANLQAMDIEVKRDAEVNEEIYQSFSANLTQLIKN